MAKLRSVHETIRAIQDGVPGVLNAAAEELFVQFYRRLMSYAKSELFDKTKTVVGASDVVQMAMRSALSDIEHGRITDPDATWDSLLFPYVLKKVLGENRDATTEHRIVKSCDSDLLDRLPSPKSELSCEDVEQTFRKFGELLHKKDGTADVFEQVVLNGLNQKEAAQKLKMSDRTIRNKMKSVINHLIDRMFSEIKMDPVIEEAFRLVFDPRSRVPANKQLPGQRLDELDRRILAAADEKGVSPEEMARRVQKARRILEGVLRDSAS